VKADPGFPDPSRSPAPIDLLSSAAVAALFGRTPRTIRNWVRAGHLHPIKVGGAVFFRRADVERLANFGTEVIEEFGEN